MTDQANDPKPVTKTVARKATKKATKKVTKRKATKKAVKKVTKKAPTAKDTKAEIRVLLDRLAGEGDTKKKKAIRQSLRRLGHTGGLRTK